MEYFGLVECNKETSPFSVIGSNANAGTNNSGNCARYYDWINLRNPLGHHGNTGQPYSLAFRVKFWVPAHLILQESVRNIFYMQAKSDLLDGRLRATDWECAARLGALLAQGDEIKFDRNALNCDDGDDDDNDTNLLGRQPATIDSTRTKCIMPRASNHHHSTVDDGNGVDDDDNNNSEFGKFYCFLLLIFLLLNFG